ncbi:MAG: diphthine--ammonia ligase [Nitrososphaeraceae archaeon]|nr:diphthine--ammonia ligase [Nitrososphaeraceae archaeon]MBV9667667.1 diphthine--ammonia ligase [Nitrososphaeraceae archaeon]
MRLAALYSGGKDSTFSILKIRELGHEVVCLVSMYPFADDSFLFHYPNIRLTNYLAQAMQIPLSSFAVEKRSKEKEFQALKEAVLKVKSDYDIQGIVHGVISSKFQKELFNRICLDSHIAMFTPLWNANPLQYMYELISKKFEIKIVGVSAMGLEKDWLGRSIDKNTITLLELLSRKYGFNLAFEGGEAESLVLDCPLFTRRLDIKKANIHWDGQRGIFEILDVALIQK